jgi:murein DD-endopeptidase MepM/ murein hydrolase activator NlpD
MEKKWNILIIPNTSEEGRNITITGSAVRAAIIGLCLLLITSSVFCAASLHVWKKRNLRELGSLQNDLAQQGTELNSLKSEYASLILLEEKLRTIAGLKPRHTQLNMAAGGGQGGPDQEEMVLYETDDETRMKFLSQLSTIPADQLYQGLVDMRDSFSEILEAFEKEQQRLSSIPSINPVSYQDAWVSSSFGYRKDPINGNRNFHEGLDIVAPRRTPVIAPADGVVTFAGWHDGLGRSIELRHGYGYYTTYGHTDKIVVRRGDHVSRGDIIAFVGSSGRSTGPHLHYEVHFNGRRLNPYPYVVE